MGEPIPATGGSSQATMDRPKAKLRLAGLVLTVLLGSILVIWVSRTTWERVGHLQHEFAGLKAKDFYLAVTMKSQIQRLNDTLLRYRLRGEAADYDQFYKESSALTEWFDANQTNAVTPLEREFFKRVSSTYNDYLMDSTNLLTARIGFLESKAVAFPTSYEKVQTQSQHLLDLCDAFIHDQSAYFDNFLQESNRTLTTFQLLLKLSLVLLLMLIAALALLVYRGAIAPLRHQLTESQATIVRQEKLASLGALAAGVAHEIRNPLTAIKFRLYSLKKSLPPGLADNEDAVVIGNEISRLERIVKDFLQFARPSEPELVAIPTQRILQEVHDLLNPQLKKASIVLKLETSKPVWIRADTQQIKQVLINLIQNSADSIGQNGVITLRARNGAGDFAIMEVADNGKGIPSDVQKRLFDPFFTTKEGGTGLGLPIAARIVEKHGGELRYQTQPNHGTVFSIVLPRFTENET
ncbi:MAG TPA: ATP-binding protein [Candidatus Saccharimonadales bacterium]|nr:ATP-binding protein [Candidatus Saccharimonadales bacterium]